jgi:monoamine oxidase
VPLPFGELRARFGADGHAAFRRALSRLRPDEADELRAGLLSCQDLRHALLRTPPPPDPSDSVDVIVVGAGLAGITAAHHLSGMGYAVRVLEASGRIGGRLLTRGGLDLGAAWLHSPRKNPLSEIVADLGLSVSADADTRWVLGGQESPEVAGRALQNKIDGLVKRMEVAVDSPASDVIPSSMASDLLAAGIVGPLSMGVELQNLSTTDFNLMAPELGDAVVNEGLQCLAEAFAAGLDIRYRQSVRGIRWRRDDVEVEVDCGGLESQRLMARTAIITVSTGVLAAGKIRFDPELPANKVRAVFDLPMGRLEKHAFLLEEGRTALACSAGTHVHLAFRDAHRVEYFVRPAGRPAVVALVGADATETWTARDSRRAFEDATGSRLAVRAAFETDWRRHPLFLGAYSAARPGRHAARAELARPLDSVVLAGEATEGEWAATATGAYLSGLRAAATAAERGARSQRRSVSVSQSPSRERRLGNSGAVGGCQPTGGVEDGPVLGRRLRDSGRTGRIGPESRYPNPESPGPRIGSR